MTQENKELLLKDLCARLPYGVKIKIVWWIVGGTYKAYQHKTLEPDHIYNLFNDEDIELKPYLRSMSNMTEEERKEYYSTQSKYTHRIYPDSADFSEHTEYSWTAKTIDWLNANHFDYRGLIPMGLAIEVTNDYESV